MKEIAAIVAAIVGGIFLVIVLWKAFVATLSITVTLAEVVVTIVYWLVNTLIVVAAVGALAAVILLGFLLLVVLLQHIKDKLDDIFQLNQQTLARIKSLTVGKPEKFAPVAIAGVVQCLVLVLKDSSVTPVVKILLSVSIWTFATLLNLTLAEWKWNRTFGWSGIALMTLIPVLLVSSAVAYLAFFEPSKLDEQVQAIRDWLNKQTLIDGFAWSLIAAFILMMPMASFILHRGRRKMELAT